MKYVRIFWVDIVGDTSWASIDEVKQSLYETPCLQESVGWIIAESKSELVLASCRDWPNGETVGGRDRIPKANIVLMVEQKDPKYQRRVNAALKVWMKEQIDGEEKAEHKESNQKAGRPEGEGQSQGTAEEQER